MKAKLAVGVGAVGLALALLGPAHGAVVADVGTLDAMVASGVVTPGGNAEVKEQAFVDGYFSSIGVSYTLTGKYENLAGWEAVTDDAWDDSWAVAFAGLSCNNDAFDGVCSITPDYYLVKTGGGATAGDATLFLFDNSTSKEWAYLRLSQIGINDIASISHFSVGDGGGGGGGSVPEPAPIALMGLAFAGMAMLRRRNKAVKAA